MAFFLTGNFILFEFRLIVCIQNRGKYVNSLLNSTNLISLISIAINYYTNLFTFDKL